MELWVLCGYVPAVTLLAICIAYRIILSRGLFDDASITFKVATACLIIGLVPLSFGILQADIQIGFICFDSCPDDVPGTIQEILRTDLSLGLLCFADWVLALYALTRGHHWRALLLALLSLPVAVVTSALMLSASSVHGEIVPRMSDIGWLYTLLYAVLPVALCWPLATIIALGMTREQVVRLPSVWRWLAPGR
jgi:hypothetical protein